MSRRAVGVDGCPDGWLCVVKNIGLSAAILPDLEAVLVSFESDAIIAIDVPIGLTDSGPRDCDLAARTLLKAPRASSVFPAPVRAALTALTYLEACELHAAADGRRMSQQAFAILPKIVEVDGILRREPSFQHRVREVHPEVCFAVWNEGQPMVHRKARAEGRAERERLIEASWPGERERLSASLRASGRRWHRDDLNDAFAALWSAQRVGSGQARVFPAQPPVDSFGLRMEMVA